MERNQKKGAGGDVRGGGELRKVFEIYALLATRFSLRLWLVRPRGLHRYAPTSVMVLKALTIHLSNAGKIFFRVFARFAVRLWPTHFLC